MGGQFCDYAGSAAVLKGSKTLVKSLLGVTGIIGISLETAQFSCMKRISIVLFFLFWATATALFAQQAAPRPHKVSLSVGAGALTGLDLVDRHLSQDLDGYKNFQYKLGYSAAFRFRTSEKWSVAFTWNHAGTDATKTGSGSGKYKERTVVSNSFSVLFERRFAVRYDSYLYWGIGVGAVNRVEEKTPVLSSNPVERSSRLGVWPQWKPIGVCLGSGPVKPYFELGLFSLPLLSGGVTVRL